MIAGDLLGVHYLASSAVSFVLVVLWGYALHARFTFQAPMSSASLIRYAVAMASNYPLSVALLFVLCDLVGLPMAVAAPVVTAILFAWNFAAARWAIASNPFATQAVGRSE
jgi:putative flippase GtrA